METLRKFSSLLVSQTNTHYVRDLYYEIDWDARLIGIKGGRGTGKTTLLLQRMKLNFKDSKEALYVSADDLWFTIHNLLDLAEIMTKEGVKYLFIDEVHHLEGWQRQIKNLYDYYKDLHIVFTGSSLLKIESSIADLSRRLLLYNLQGLSFREYLGINSIQVPKLTLHEVLYQHTDIASKICKDHPIIKYFHRYLKTGFYPFCMEEKEKSYFLRLNNIILTVIERDIPSVENIEYVTLQKLKQLVAIMASQSPSPLNVERTSQMLNVSRNQLIKLFKLLDQSQILRLLYYKSDINPKSMVKPDKVLFYNSNFLYALGHEDLGKIRESFLVSMIPDNLKVGYPIKGDVLLENRYIIEIGGRSKDFRQIASLPDSFIALDDLEVGMGNHIPLWLFGLLY